MSDDEKKTIKFQMMMSPAEAEALDDWGFKRRIRSRAETIRRLCQIGLLSLPNSNALLKSMIDADNKMDEDFNKARELIKSDNFEEFIDAFYNIRIRSIKIMVAMMADLSEDIISYYSLSSGEDTEKAIELTDAIRAKLKGIDKSSDEYRELIVGLLRATTGSDRRKRQAASEAEEGDDA